jgi:cellulose synthase/poly-beta-1,6-N-acetylglucosamine synthase-like glycosyltransferase
MLGLLTVLLLVLSSVYGLLMVGYAIGFLLEARRMRHRRSEQVPSPTSVSVVIPARNEQAHIRSCLKSILSNDYPAEAVEVIVVDDGSSDQTAEIVREVATRHPNVHLAATERGNGKKHAIEVGIGLARSPIIVTTDADCTVPRGWISGLTDLFQDGTDMVAGPVLLSSDGSILNGLASLESLGLLAISAGGLGAGLPSTCNGANLAYRQEAFLRVNGFSGIDHVPTGDDDMLMHKILYDRPGSVRFCLSRNVEVTTELPPTRGRIWSQRVRWASKGPRYRSPAMVAVLASVYAFYVTLLVAALLIPVFPHVAPLVGAALAVKLVAEVVLLLPASRMFARTRLLWLLVPGQLVQIPYVVVVGLAGAIGVYSWKGRVSVNS